MKKSLKKLISISLSLLGALLMLYLGGYWMLARPVYLLFSGLKDGTLTVPLLFSCLIRLFLCGAVSGAIWCTFDILAGFFRDYPEEE